MTREWVHGTVALALGLFLLGASPTMTFLRSLINLTGNVLSVPEYPVVMIRELSRDIYLWSRNKNELARRLESLKDENSKLRIINSVLVSEQIKAELDSRTNDARVTLREPNSWWNEFRIDKGFHDGIIMGLPVFQNGFLVGRVSSVSTYSSWVELLTSSALIIPVVVEETRELGVVVGDGNGSVFLTYIPEGRGIESGMKVSTALVGELLPPGLPIGVILKETTTSGNGYATYKITPGASLGTLYSVSILRHSKDLLK